MDTHSSKSITAMYIERLQHAVRVMEGLSDHERSRFDIDVFAARRERGVCACIGGFCGFDPWFQAQGFRTFVSDDLYHSRGHVSIPLEIFFGTHEPFFRCYYGIEFRYQRISVDDAIAALKKAIASFQSTSTSNLPAASTSAAA